MALRAFAVLALVLGGVADAREVPAEYRAALEAARRVGITMYVHDNAAWRATDELARRKVLERDERIRGWLTDAIDHGVEVLFIGDVDGAPRGLYRLRVMVGDDRPEYEKLRTPAALDASHGARWKARVAALAALQQRDDRCGVSYNTVVLPFDPLSGDLIRVYLLAATNEADVMVAGGHFLYEYSADGERLVNQRSFTRSCIDVRMNDDSRGKVSTAVLTHLLDPTPTEIHVFLSRSMSIPIMVMTGEKDFWLVNGNTDIQLLDEPTRPAKDATK